MKLKKAHKILKDAGFINMTGIQTKGKKKEGYLVTFEVREGGILSGDHFPDFHAGENPIADEDIAWTMARRWAFATNTNTVNIYVISVPGFGPVANYREKKLRHYSPGSGF